MARRSYSFQRMARRINETSAKHIPINIIALALNGMLLLVIPNTFSVLGVFLSATALCITKVASFYPSGSSDGNQTQQPNDQGQTQARPMAQKAPKNKTDIEYEERLTAAFTRYEKDHRKPLGAAPLPLNTNEKDPYQATRNRDYCAVRDRYLP